MACLSFFRLLTHTDLVEILHLIPRKPSASSTAVSLICVRIPGCDPLPVCLISSTKERMVTIPYHGLSCILLSTPCSRILAKAVL